MGELFRNRTEAGKLLAAKLEKYRGTDTIVLGVPRGGVPVAYEIARELRLPLDILLSKKIGHPLNSEVAIGSVSTDTVFVDERTDVSEKYIREKTETIRKLLKERSVLYRGNRPEPVITGKTAILVDDGIATGHTLLATLRMLRKKQPAKLVVAVPVAPARGHSLIQQEADEFVCLLTPDYFPGVGAFYIDFAQVSDEEVIRLLKAAHITQTT